MVLLFCFFAAAFIEMIASEINSLKIHYRSVVMVVVQAEERNMYDQHWLCSVLKERYPFDLY